MGEYKFTSDELKEETLITEEDIQVEAEEPFDVPIESEPAPAAVSVTKKTTAKLRVRKEPNGIVLKVLNKGARVEVIEEQGDWSKLIDGTFVMSQFLK